MCKPFIKWAGGKNQLLNELIDNLPKKYNKYYEPFIGGGALFFNLKPNNAYISDINSELVNLYQVVKNSVNELIKDLNKHENTEEYFYEIRNLDRDINRYNQLSNIEKASRFIYLNKTCFNGLYRVNSKNQFNVPFGKYKNPKYLDEENLLSCSRELQSIEIIHNDFTNIKTKIKKDDFIYFDPPYVPLNETSNFTSYTKDKFNQNRQIELKELCDFVNSKGAFFMLSNSYTDFTLDLYRDYDVKTVFAKRAINSKANNRGNIKELLVTNY